MLLELPDYRVSREISDKLSIYHKLLLKWQNSINLVSKATLNDLKVRHFDDSLQLCSLMLEAKILYDIGSGAGFPGLVLANFINTHLIESDQRKCQFLKTVSREANIPVTIHNSRIESVDISPPDIITARALSSLIQLIEWTEKWWSKNKDIRMIFLKGEKVNKEIEIAKKKYFFDYITYYSKTDTNGRILVLTNLKRIS